jgi:ABC-type lipoprotein export system ATPase subunit
MPEHGRPNRIKRMSKVEKWLIETHQLTRIYGEGEQVIRALDRVNLRIAHGELVAVMGPSGSGKSTLLNLLGALDKPTSGQILIDGQDLAKIRDKDAFRAKYVGFIFQLHNLMPTMTALENIEVPMMGQQGALQRRQRSRQLLATVGLEDRMHHLPNQLSGGQRQRVAVARALANDPLLILADEPTGNLDSVAGQDLIDLLRHLNQTIGSTIIIVTHDQKVARMANRVLIMADGKIIREDKIGSPIEEDLKMWSYSELGQHILMGNTADLDISEEQLSLLRKLLENSDGKTGENELVK